MIYIQLGHTFILKKSIDGYGIKDLTFMKKKESNAIDLNVFSYILLWKK